VTILVGFEIGTGRRIEIPAEGHLAWFGQTQLSGKTTALEGIVFRGHLKAIAFITKQGEGSFLTGRQIQPFFSEPTNDEEQPLWRWVKSILEASQQRRLNFEESWIIRACQDPKLATSLADVHSNIKALLAGDRATRYTGKRRGAKTKEVWIRKPVAGMNAGVYTSLKAYFDIVMPQLARLPYTTRLELKPGLNVMDLREYAMETQALVIRSVMEWVYQHEKNVRVIVPESQDFVPQGKNSPVKMACETLVRKAGANKNFMWLDSQDMAAVDKVMLRACSIVGCGVQREMHEIDRTLASMFSPALKPLDVAKLKLGEFFVCTPGANVSKVYVMPAWMDSEVHAQAIAKGEVSVETTRLMLRKFADERKADAGSPKLGEFQELPHEGTSDASHMFQVTEDETVWKEKYDALRAEYQSLTEAHDALANRMKLLEGRSPAATTPTNGDAHVPIAGNIHADSFSLRDIYKFVKQCAEEDPGILELLSFRPELHVKIERPAVSLHGNQVDGRVAKLIADKFLDTPKDRAAIGAELVRIGALKRGTNLKILSPALAKLSNLGFLTIEPNGYQAVPGMKIEIHG
jgi:hypothetical protein